MREPVTMFSCQSCLVDAKDNKESSMTMQQREKNETKDRE